MCKYVQMATNQLFQFQFQFQTFCRLGYAKLGYASLDLMQSQAKVSVLSRPTSCLSIVFHRVKRQRRLGLSLSARYIKFATTCVHSHREIINTMCKTGQDALRKRKPCRKLFIHISNKSASNKLNIVSMESSKLLCLNGTSFCSKSCDLKTFPLSIISVLTLVVDGPRL